MTCLRVGPLTKDLLIQNGIRQLMPATARASSITMRVTAIMAGFSLPTTPPKGMVTTPITWTVFSILKKRWSNIPPKRQLFLTRIGRTRGHWNRMVLTTTHILGTNWVTNRDMRWVGSLFQGMAMQVHRVIIIGPPQINCLRDRSSWAWWTGMRNQQS